MEETAQVFGKVFETEEEVIEHLRVQGENAGKEWNGVDKAELYEAPALLMDGLSQVGETVWYQRY